jgi:hypothetical protein
MEGALMHQVTMKKKGSTRKTAIVSRPTITGRYGWTTSVRV